MAAMKKTILLFLFLSFSSACYGLYLCDGSVQSGPYPGDCTSFFECIPGRGHVVKSCGEGTMYNTVYKVCDWPDNVKLIRPECKPDRNPMMGSSRMISIYQRW